jgi:DNA-binding response OmpR family regulator
MYVTKSVLLVDCSPLLSEFLQDKFSVEQISIESVSNREAYTKILTLLSDLIIIELDGEVSEDVMHVLEKVHVDPNARKIPIIVIGPVVERSKITHLLEFGVIRYFTKPINFGAFFDSVGKILKSPFSNDPTPCVCDVHFNGSVIFVELAGGLNREKIRLLKYRIAEIIEKVNINIPKVILVLSSFQFSFVDGANIEFLLDSIKSDGRVANKNIKILSTDDFLKQLVMGHTEYLGMEISDNVRSIASAVLNMDLPQQNVEEFLVDNLFLSSHAADDKQFNFMDKNNLAGNGGTMLKIAIVDDDVVIRKLLENTFTSVSGESELFEDANSFLASVAAGKDYDIVVLDLYLPDMDGISILRTLQRRGFQTPILIYSKAAARDVVVQALSLGARSYLVKPQKPGVVLRKVIEILHSQD